MAPRSVRDLHVGNRVRSLEVLPCSRVLLFSRSAGVESAVWCVEHATAESLCDFAKRSDRVVELVLTILRHEDPAIIARAAKEILGNKLDAGRLDSVYPSIDRARIGASRGERPPRLDHLKACVSRGHGSLQHWGVSEENRAVGHEPRPRPTLRFGKFLVAHFRRLAQPRRGDKCGLATSIREPSRARQLHRERRRRSALMSRGAFLRTSLRGCLSRPDAV